MCVCTHVHMHTRLGKGGIKNYSTANINRIVPDQLDTLSVRPSVLWPPNGSQSASHIVFPSLFYLTTQVVFCIILPSTTVSLHVFPSV